MCTQNSKYNQTLREIQLKSKLIESNDFLFNNLLLIIAVVVK